MNVVISSLYFIILLFFVYNFKELYSKIKSNKKSNKLSLLATSSLIFQFGSLGVHFVHDCENIIIASQLYLLGCILYLIYYKRMKKQGA